MTKTYDNPPIGCYLDQGLRNATEHDVATVRIAESYGFPVDGEMERILDAGDGSEDDIDGDDAQALSEMADDAIDYLNDQETRTGLYWANDGDAGAFGLWPSVESAREQVEFISRNKIDDTTDPDDSSYPHPDFRGEWLHVSDHGNATLYVRSDDGSGYRDTEIWSVV